LTERIDVPYSRANGRDLLLDIFSPDPDRSLRTAVLQFHGGGWRGGSRKSLAPHAELLCAQGFTAIPTEYRPTGESPWPAQIQDVKAAIRWVRANAVSLGVDPDRIVLEGFSAGAQLSLLAAGTADRSLFEREDADTSIDTSVAAVAAFYPPTLFQVGETRQSGSLAASALLGDDASPDEAAAASPLTYVSGGFPPTFFLHGGADKVVPTSASVIMYDALRAAGVDTDLHIFSGQTHGFDHVDVFREIVNQEVALFFRRTVSEKSEIAERIIEQSMFARRAAEATAGRLA
jgi:acetyl esterase/lipase